MIDRELNPLVDLTIAPEGHVRWHHSPNGIDIMKPAIIGSSQPAPKLVRLREHLTSCRSKFG